MFGPDHIDRVAPLWSSVPKHSFISIVQGKSLLWKRFCTGLGEHVAANAIAIGRFQVQEFHDYIRGADGTSLDREFVDQPYEADDSDDEWDQLACRLHLVDTSDVVPDQCKLDGDNSENHADDVARIDRISGILRFIPNLDVLFDFRPSRQDATWAEQDRRRVDRRAPLESGQTEKLEQSSEDEHPEGDERDDIEVQIGPVRAGGLFAIDLLPGYSERETKPLSDH